MKWLSNLNLHHKKIDQETFDEVFDLTDQRLSFSNF